MKESVDLTFSCNEDLAAMSCTERGQFCQSCQKEVIDYRFNSISEIRALSNGGKDLCGIFTPEQIEPDLHPIQFPKQVKSFAFLSSMFIWLGVSNVNAQSTVDPKFEQAESTSNSPQLTPEEAEAQQQSGDPISMSIGNTVTTPIETPTKEESREEQRAKQHRQKYIKRIIRRGNKKWFWSKRFPFIHKRRRISAGRYHVTNL
ncbi:MAG: hypothetical protein ACI837_003456 [Crocinitomicaceae bacterium]|jgi:hypothetical protein